MLTAVETMPIARSKTGDSVHVRVLRNCLILGQLRERGDVLLVPHPVRRQLVHQGVAEDTTLVRVVINGTMINNRVCHPGEQGLLPLDRALTLEARKAVTILSKPKEGLDYYREDISERKSPCDA